MLLWWILTLAWADEIPTERWPAIAAACNEAFPERATLQVSEDHTQRCLAGGHPAGLCQGRGLVSPSVAACIGNTLANPHGVRVFGPHAAEVGLVYELVLPLRGAEIREHGWYVDAATGAVVSDWHGPQLNMMTWEPRGAGLPFQ